MGTRTSFGSIVISILACLLLFSPQAMADKGRGAFKLEGAWIAKVIGFPGQWSYVVSADPSGRRASAHGSIEEGFDPSAFGCELGETDSDSPILINLELTGPDTGIAYSIWYSLKTLDTGLTEVVYIGEVRSHFRFVAPGKNKGTHYFAFYLPSQDLNPEDGLPDEGEMPACTVPFPFYTIDTRLPAP